ncbi:MAG: hypothetical protein C0168_03320 [Candidatus Aminicenantes bacterium]|nr:MAG: hypothetical protein C0168_03320 [Candidatus Aminicenantes bacterium]
MAVIISEQEINRRFLAFSASPGGLVFRIVNFIEISKRNLRADFFRIGDKGNNIFFRVKA